MKLTYSVFKAAACTIILLSMACSNNKTNPKLIGEWHDKTDKSLLKITGKTFMMESDSPEPEDYFVKGDTIFTSYQGNLPYTKYVIQKLDMHNLDLFTPDSVVVQYTK